jgi:hypothetical protein
MVVNAAEMLELVRTPKEQVELTVQGREFILSDVNGRKMLLNLQLQKLRIITHVMEMLQRSHEGWLSKELLLEEFAVLFPSENPARLFNTLVAWVRYAELLGYSARRGQLYLDRVFVIQGGLISETKNPRPKPLPRAHPVAAVPETQALPQQGDGEPPAAAT